MRGTRPKSIHRSEYAVLLRLLRDARRQAGKTQAEIADCLGCQTSAVSKLERGELRFDFLQVRDYLLAVGMSLEELVQRFETALSDPPGNSGDET